MKKQIKNSILNIRVSEEQKEKIKLKADSLNMSLSKFILETLENGSINIIEGGQELAEAIYDLNKTLNKFEKCPTVYEREIRDVVTNAVGRITRIIESKGEKNVNIKI